MITLRLISLCALTLGLSACANSPAYSQAEEASVPRVCLDLPEGDYCAYEETRDPAEAISEAQAIAAEEGLNTIIVMGANWCHDSRALAGHFQRDRFQDLISAHYQLVYVDVGRKDRNIDIAQSFGLPGIVGTPTVIITDSDGSVLNLEEAPTWRNAASRSEDEIYAYFERYATQE